jgi:hypothetical protein
MGFGERQHAERGMEHRAREEAHGACCTSTCCAPLASLGSLHRLVTPATGHMRVLAACMSLCAVHAK